MNKILCKVSDDDAKKLYDTIIEVEASHELYDTSMKQIDLQPIAIKTALDYYMEALKSHKRLWKEILLQYIAEDDAASMYNILRFDPVKKVIFELEIDGCSLCK